MALPFIRSVSQAHTVFIAFDCTATLSSLVGRHA